MGFWEWTVRCVAAMYPTVRVPCNHVSGLQGQGQMREARVTWQIPVHTEPNSLLTWRFDRSCRNYAATVATMAAERNGGLISVNSLRILPNGRK